MICPAVRTLSQMIAHHSRKFCPSGLLFMLHKMLRSRGLAMINLSEKEPVIQLVLVRLTTVVCCGPWPVANNISKNCNSFCLKRRRWFKQLHHRHSSHRSIWSPIGKTIDLKERNAQPPAASKAAFHYLRISVCDEIWCKSMDTAIGYMYGYSTHTDPHKQIDAVPTVTRDLGAFKGRTRAPRLLSYDPQKQHLWNNPKAKKCIDTLPNLLIQ